MMDNDPREIPGDAREVTGGRIAGIAATALSLSVAIVSSVTLVLAWQATTTTRDVQRDLAESVRENRRSEHAHTCTSFQGQREIMDRIDRIAVSAGLPADGPPLKLTDATRSACRFAEIPLDEQAKAHDE